MCDCESSGITIPIEQGDPGEQGGYGGFSARWEWETSTATGPSTGKTRFNNATPALVTGIYIHETNADAIAASAFIASFGTSGLIKLFKEDDSTVFWMGELTGQIDNGSDRTLNVTYVLHNGTFAANDSIVVTFTPAEPGIAGEDGTSIIANDFTTNALTNSGSFTNLGGGTVLADTLITNGDKIKVTVNFTKEVPTVKGDTWNHRCRVNNDAIITNIYNFAIPHEVVSGYVILEMSRVSSTTAMIEYKSFFVNQLGVLIPGFGGFTRSVAIDFSEDISFTSEFSNTSTTYDITYEQFTIELVKIPI